MLLLHASISFYQDSTMDRHKTQSNRDKTKEVFKSGNAKREMAKEKEKKNEVVLAKSRRLTDFITKCNATPSTYLLFLKRQKTTMSRMTT